MSKLLARAKVKRENAENSYRKMGEEDAYRDDCCYNLQQAIEMTLKAIVELYGEQYAENHDVRANLNILNKIGIEVPEQKEIRAMASTIYGWETESRYRDDFVSLREDIDQAREIADHLIQYCDGLLYQTEVKNLNDIPERKLSDDIR